MTEIGQNSSRAHPFQKKKGKRFSFLFKSSLLSYFRRTNQDSNDPCLNLLLCLSCKIILIIYIYICILNFFQFKYKLVFVILYISLSLSLFFPFLVELLYKFTISGSLFRFCFLNCFEKRFFFNVKTFFTKIVSFKNKNLCIKNIKKCPYLK